MILNYRKNSLFETSQLQIREKKIFLRYTPIFYYNCFIVLAFTFRYLVHYELIFVCGVRERSNFILLHLEILFEDHLLRKLKFIQNKRKTVWSFLMQYSSHWPQHVKCSSCKLRYTISVNHTLDFKYLM